MTTQHFTECPELVLKNEYAWYALKEDLSNYKFGKLTVIGLLKDKKTRWVCQCTCGDFEVRTTKAVTNPSNKHDACANCRQTTPTKELLEPIAPIRNKPPERTGCGKMGFKSLNAAKQAIKSRLQHGANCNKLRAYYCKQCNRYHMTSSFNNK